MRLEFKVKLGEAREDEGGTYRRVAITMPEGFDAARMTFLLEEGEERTFAITDDFDRLEAQRRDVEAIRALGAPAPGKGEAS